MGAITEHEPMITKSDAFARRHGRVTMMDAIRSTGASRNTLKSHFRELTERNHLERQGSGRGVWYALK